MKDEEMANRFREDLVCSTKRLIGRENYEYIERAFLAGLKAGRTQWHDLRKDPTDLPKGSRIVSDQEGNNVKYVEHLNKWFYRHITCKANVIAWCEIPKLLKT